MTGFGSGRAPLGSGGVLLEIRALNHRYVEVRVRLPAELLEHAFFVEQQARERLGRGRYDVGVRIEGAALPPPGVSYEHARAAWHALKRLTEELSPGEPLQVSVLASLPGVITPIGPEPEATKTALALALELAIAGLDAMRKSEGDALREELARRLSALRTLRAAIAARAPGLGAEWRKRLAERLGRALGEVGATLDPARLEAEVVLFADRSDVTEELVRLASHFDQLERLVGADEPVGRRFEFLLQEIGREANTIGSKCQDAALSHLVVELKAEIERMREQVQNVE